MSSTGGKERDVSGNHAPASNAPKKFLNGWTPEQERLMGSWADVAGCYRWLHDKSEKKYTKSNMLITIPVIILSTLTGTANFALSSFIPADDLSAKNYASAAIGAVSIFAGILTTLGNFLRFAQGSEAHRVASVAWGKFQRQIAVEISIHPDDRMDCMDFLNICRQDLDRLIEQSPPIPDDVIAMFEKEFKDVPNLKRPDICHGLEHTIPYSSTKPRLMKMVADATIYLKQRKKLLRDDILPDVSDRIAISVKSELEMALQKKWDEFEKRNVVEVPAEPEAPAPQFNFTGNWRRLIGATNADLPPPISLPNSLMEHDEIVEVDEEALLTETSINELVSSSNPDMVISMKVNDVITPKPDEPPESLTPPISHTTHFD